MDLMWLTIAFVVLNQFIHGKSVTYIKQIVVVSLWLWWQRMTNNCTPVHVNANFTQNIVEKII